MTPNPAPNRGFSCAHRFMLFYISNINLGPITSRCSGKKPVRKRGFASSWSFSKRFKERKQRSLQIWLSTFTLERGISNIPQILFRRSETFPFNYVLLLESFSSKPHKTQLVFVTLNLVGITSMVSMALYAIHLIEIFANKQSDLTAARVLGE